MLGLSRNVSHTSPSSHGEGLASSRSPDSDAHILCVLPSWGAFFGGGYPLGQLSGEEFLSKDFLSPSVPTAPGPLISVPVGFLGPYPRQSHPLKDRELCDLTAAKGRVQGLVAWGSRKPPMAALSQRNQSEVFFFFFFLEKQLDQLHGPAEAFPGSRQATCRGGGGDLVGPASYRVA